MTADYTPTMQELEDDYSAIPAPDGSPLGKSSDRDRAAFRRALAAHDAEVAVTVLREAAQDWGAHMSEFDGYAEHYLSARAASLATVIRAAFPATKDPTTETKEK
ncbi:hypothetical protein [Frigoribacterium sp. UYMn621]|uniref:hypothetical protein n=1 Tax=Frigoribacterium sp. UYMn621 TaxID=3156343 RepID=UPI003399C59A